MCLARAGADGLRASGRHGSLTAEGLDMHCPNCASDRLTAIHIRLAPDEDHTFASCQACEWKGWSNEGGEVPLGRVLALASERRF
jgi:uncharacterized protein (DUF983 family)